MDIMKKSFFLQLSFVLLLCAQLMLCAGFTCQKKYPPPPTESNAETTSETPSDADSSSENSNSTSETPDSADGETEKPVDKTDK